MSAIDFPTSTFAVVLGLGILIGFASDVRRVAALANFTIDGLANVAFFETKMLRLRGRRLGPFERSGVQRLGDHLPIRHIGAVDGHSQPHASAIDLRRTFDARLAEIGRVFPRFFPTQRWLGHRAILALPLPSDSVQLVVLCQGEFPKLFEHARLRPLLEISIWIALLEPNSRGIAVY